MKNKTKPKFKDPNFEAIRIDKTKTPLPTKREYEINKFHTALAMMKDFGYHPWMSNPDVIGENRDRINKNGEIYIPRFRRKV